MLRKLRNRRGTEIVQILIVLAVFGAITIGVANGLSGALLDQNEKVIDHVSTLIDDAIEYTPGDGSGN